MIMLRVICMFILIVQALAAILVFRSIFIKGPKTMMLFGPCQMFLRLSFIIIVWICAANDIATIRFQGLWVYREVTFCTAFWNIATCMLRMLVTHFIFFTVAVFILTTESKDPEDYISLAMKFSALLIVIRLDEMVIGAYFNALGREQAFDDVEEPT